MPEPCLASKLNILNILRLSFEQATDFSETLLWWAQEYCLFSGTCHFRSHRDHLNRKKLVIENF